MDGVMGQERTEVRVMPPVESLSVIEIQTVLLACSL